MKNTALSAVLLAIAAACSQDTLQITVPQQEPVDFLASISATKTSYVSGSEGINVGWSSSDKIGIYTVVGGMAQNNNLAYSASAAGSSTSFNAVSDKANWKDDSSVHDFYAYYPYSEGTYPFTAVPVSVEFSQVQSSAGDMSHLSSSEIMYASVSTARTSSVSMAFNHALPILELDLTSSIDGLYVTQVEASFKVNKIAGNGTLNLTDGTISETDNNVVTLILDTPCLLSSTPSRLYMHITPGHASDELTLTVTANGEELKFVKTPSAAILGGQIAKLPVEVSPAKRVSGLRESSRIELWHRKVSEIAGVQSDANVSGIAVSKGHVLLSENGNTHPAYINALTGEDEGRMDVSAFTTAEGNTNYYATSDSDGNILMCPFWSKPDEAKTLRFYVASSVSATPVASGATRSITASKDAAGWKMSVKGSINSNAIVSIPFYAGAAAYTTQYLINWQYSGGKLVSGNWFTNLGTFTAGQTYPKYADGVYSEPNKYADIFHCNYANQSDGKRYMFWFYCSDPTGSGKFTVRAKKESPINGDPINATDCIQFNGVTYFAHNIVAQTTKPGSNDVFLYEATPGDFSKEIHLMDSNEHGTVGSNFFSDVQMVKSDDGNYMYVYVMFSAGNIACYRYDCFVD